MIEQLGDRPVLPHHLRSIAPTSLESINLRGTFDFPLRIMSIVLNRPEAMNSLDPESLAELNNAFEAANRDENVRVVVLTGNADKAFCTGSDLKETMPPEESFA